MRRLLQNQTARIFLCFFPPPCAAITTRVIIVQLASGRQKELIFAGEGREVHRFCASAAALFG